MALLRWSCAVLGIVVATLSLSACALMRGNEYPASDITFIVSWAPGGSADPVARTLVQESEGILKRKFVVVNKPGASASLGVGEIVASKPDGYTLGLGSMVANVTTPLTMKTPYGGPDDYQPLVHLIWQPSILVVKADSPWKSLDDLVSDAKKRPGAIRVSISSKLDNDDLAIQQLNMLYNVEITAVPFSSGGGESITALLGGHVEATSGKAPQIRPLVEAGQVRPIAIMQGKRSTALPNVPTANEQGYKLTIPQTGYFTLGPKGMDKAVVDKLVNTFTTAVKAPTFQKFAQENGFTVDPLGPAELTKELKNEWSVYSQIFKELKVPTVR